MKILHVIADLDPSRGGPAQACIGMARASSARGHAVRIVTTDRGLPEMTGSDVAIDAYPASVPHVWGTSWAMRRHLPAAIRAADIVHLHSLYLFHDWITGDACHRLGRPYIVRPHGTLDPYLYARHRGRKRVMELLFQNRVLRRAAGLHYTTEAERRLARPYARNPHGWVVANGIDLALYADLPPRTRLREIYPQIGDRRVVLFFGRLNFKKGLEVTIRAFAEVAAARPDLFLVLAGPDDGERDRVLGWIAETGIADRTLLTGMVTGEVKRAVLAGSDIFVLPSLSENFGIAVIEAAACGLPVIVSDRVNLCDLVASSGAGLVAAPETSAFATALAQLADQPSLAAAMGASGRALAAERFGWAAIGVELDRMYEAAIAHSAAPR